MTGITVNNSRPAGSGTGGGPSAYIVESGGPTTLTASIIPDGTFFKRVGTDITGSVLRTETVKPNLSAYPYTPTTTDRDIIVNNTSSALTIQLPNPAITKGRISFSVMGDATTYPITVARFGSERIALSAGNYTVYGFMPTFSFVTDLTDWYITS